ncbi:MAG: NAD-dependent epimerase/dehydratase family protein [Phycisphaeraceae bacterium]
MANILITGGAGFIGSHTADELIKRGHQVRALDLLDPQVHGPHASRPAYLHPQVELVPGDVRHPHDIQRALVGIDAVYHFASLTGVGQSMYEMRSYVDTNVAGTATLLDVLAARQRAAAAGKAQPLRRVVLASSRAVYGEGTCQRRDGMIVYPNLRERQAMEAGDFDTHCPNTDQPVAPVATQEDRPCAPISVYGWTKKQQEDYCILAAKTQGLPVVCLRYFNVYGSRQALGNPYTGVVSVFYNRLMAGQPIALYEHGLPRRDFVHVSDVVAANVLALTADVPAGECINIGAGEGHTIHELAETLRDLVQLGGDLEDTSKFRVGDVWACYADLARARQRLGYEPRTSLRQGLQEFLHWARRQDTVDRSAQAEEELRHHNLLGEARKDAA